MSTESLFVYDPIMGFDKLELVDEARWYGTHWLKRQSLPTPIFEIHEDEHSPISRGKRVRGFYSERKGPNGTIHIYLKDCRPPTVNPGYAWSYPGYKADVTPYGVLMHELGHHADFIMGRISKTWQKNVDSWERPVTSYAHNSQEMFAEAFRLFMTNPDMLRRGRPLAFSFLEDLFTPPNMLFWEDVLKHANPRFIVAGRNWMKGSARAA